MRSQVTNIPEGYEVVFEDDESAALNTSNNTDATTSSVAAASSSSASAAHPSPDTPAAESNTEPATAPHEGVFRAKATQILTVSTDAVAANPSPKKRSFFQKLWSKSPFAKKKRGDSNSARTKMQAAKALDARINGP